MFHVPSISSYLTWSPTQLCQENAFPAIHPASRVRAHNKIRHGQITGIVQRVRIRSTLNLFQI